MAVSLTSTQKKTCQAIVNVFETGSPIGDYGAVTVLRGDTGHLTYGRSQTTLGSGNLHLLIDAYCREDGAAFGVALSEYLSRLEDRDVSLDQDPELHELLREAGEDPVMRAVQDAFFDRVYWNPAVAACDALGVSSPLSVGVVYDSHIHGSWRRIRDRVIERHGRPDGDEETWIEHYVKTRRDWLAGHRNELLHRTVYRMDTFQGLIGERHWKLALPLAVRGVTIDEAVLAGDAPARISAEDDERVLKLRRPLMRGADVAEIQQALADAGFAVEVDGLFGPGTELAVIRFQKREGLVVDGVVGAATRARLLD